jgi:hypothetical protein
MLPCLLRAYLQVSGTLIQQLIATLFSSFGNYAIANCDTVENQNCDTDDCAFAYN